MLHADGAEGAEHEQRAMSEVDDAKRAEDKRQAESNERVGPAFVETVEKLENNRVQHFAAYAIAA